MEEATSFFSTITNPEFIIHTGGLILILAIVFAENGVFFGFFLPGDTLLFTAGLLVATDKFQIPILLLLFSVLFAAILGSLFGYFFGTVSGKGFRERKDGLFFKKKYIDAAEAFFNKYGGRALVLGRFLPIIRTFAPIFAGIVKLDFKEYMMYNVVGAFLWVFLMTLMGYYAGAWIPNAKDYLEYIIIGIMVITWTPVITTYIKEQRKKNNTV